MSRPTLNRVLVLGGGLVLAYALAQGLSLSQGKTVPLGVLALGLVFASLNALFAVGLVLVYRAARIINFAQAGPGAVATLLFLVLGDAWGYLPGLAAALVGAAIVGIAVEVLIVRRFFKAPRLVLTVATLGIAQLLTQVAFLLPGLLLQLLEGPYAALRGLAAITQARPSPFASFEFSIYPLTFTGDHVAAVVVSVAILAGLAAFFRFAPVGVAIRGAAENDDRASLLGVNTRTLSTMVWGLAAVLSAVSAILAIPFQFGGGAQAAAQAVVGAGSLNAVLRALAAAVLARMENLPTTVVAAFAIGIVQQGMFWAFDDTSLMNVALLALILGALLVQRAKLARTDEGLSGTWAATEEMRKIPGELADLPQVRRGVRRFALAIVTVVVVFPWVMAPSQTSVFAIYFIYGIIAISLVVLTGWGGQISLGQFAFVAMGGVIGATLFNRTGLPFVVAALVGCLAGGALAVLLGLPALRIRGLFLAATTLGFSVCVSTVLLNRRYFGWLLPPQQLRRPKLLWIDFEDERAYYYLCLLALVATVLAVEGIRHTRTGRVLIAMRDNERYAQSFGVSLVKVRLATFALSGFLAAFAGVLFVHHQHAVDPASFAPEQSVQMFLMAVIGGLGSVRGVLVGAAYLASTAIILPNTVGQVLATSLGALFVLYVFPSGLGGLVYAVRDTWLRRIANRMKIVVPSLVGDYRLGLGELSKAPIAPKFGADGQEEETPVVFRLPSRIGVAGSSQDRSFWGV